MTIKEKPTPNILVRKWQGQSYKDKLYWMKTIFAIVGAFISTIIRPVMFSPLLDSPFTDQHPALIAAVIGVLIMLGLSALVSWLLLQITPDLIGGRMAYLTTGLMTGLFLWLVIWTVLYNIILSLSPPITLTQLIQYWLLLYPL
jgi:uncharacterized membrane protein YeaQ/YmgE (transglycosylase-associated protein family)